MAITKKLISAIKFRENRISLILFVGLFSLCAQAGSVAFVTQMRGQVFLVKDQKTSLLKVGDQVPDISQIVTDENSHVTLYDFHDHRFHLSNSTFIEIMNLNMELKQGKIWIQSTHQKERDPLMIRTANSSVETSKGEAIVTFDAHEGKTQLFSINGRWHLANSLSPEQKVEVEGGSFSIVENSQRDGLPRRSTKIGEKSYQKVTARFDGISPLKKGLVPFQQKRARRGLASVSPMDQRSKTSWNIGGSQWGHSQRVQERIPRPMQAEIGESVVLHQRPKVERGVSSFSKEKFYRSQIKKIQRKRARRPNYSRKSSLKLLSFGLKKRADSKKDQMNKQRKVTPKKQKTTRLPAGNSIQRPRGLQHSNQNKSEFQQSVTEQYKKQMRHSRQVNDLIDDLKSVRIDYKSSY